MTTKYERTVAAEAARRASLTPYDTGKRAEPKVWTKSHIEDDNDYGKVDFDDEEDATIATLYIEQSDDRSYTLKGYTNEPLTIDVTDQTDEGLMRVVQPSAALQIRVKALIDDLDTEYEREEADVYWQGNRAVIIVPGEKHVRKQQIINVHETGGEMSAYVKDWADGVRDTRIG